ncbi:protein of unknown function [Paraburkholderia kururiensis]
MFGGRYPDSFLCYPCSSSPSRSLLILCSDKLLCVIMPDLPPVVKYRYLRRPYSTDILAILPRQIITRVSPGAVQQYAIFFMGGNVDNCAEEHAMRSDLMIVIDAAIERNSTTIQ